MEAPRDQSRDRTWQRAGPAGSGSGVTGARAGGNLSALPGDGDGRHRAWLEGIDEAARQRVDTFFDIILRKAEELASRN